jgi:hypothetical protein
MRQAGQNHPFYKPLWRRIVIVACTIAWVAFELLYGASGLWQALSIGVLAYCTWTFLVVFPKES